MKIKYCRKYEKYVSRQHCEFFNEGCDCEFYTSKHWNSINDLLDDKHRPKWDISAIIKPFKCKFLNGEYLNHMNRKQRLKRLAVAVLR